MLTLTQVEHVDLVGLSTPVGNWVVREWPDGHWDFVDTEKARGVTYKSATDVAMALVQTGRDWDQAFRRASIAERALTEARSRERGLQILRDEEVTQVRNQLRDLRASSSNTEKKLRERATQLGMEVETLRNTLTLERQARAEAVVQYEKENQSLVYGRQMWHAMYEDIKRKFATERRAHWKLRRQCGLPSAPPSQVKKSKGKKAS